MVDLTELQYQIHEWRKRNFPGANSIQQLLGVTEEVGELSHAHLKAMQGIRGTPQQHQEAAMDAVGDILIYLMGYCSCLGWKIEGILEATTARVLARDWIADPVAGGEGKPGVVGAGEDEMPTGF